MIASCDYSLLKHSSNQSNSLAHKRLFTHPHSLPSLTVPSYLIFFRIALIFLIIPLSFSSIFSLRSLKMSSLLYTIVSCVLPTSRCRWGCSNTCVYSCMSNNPTPTAFFFFITLVCMLQQLNCEISTKSFSTVKCSLWLQMNLYKFLSVYLLPCPF